MEVALQIWHNFFSACLQKRPPPDKFQIFVKACLFNNDAPSGRRLVGALVAESRKTALADPRVPLYVNELINLKLCSAADVLLSLLPPPLPDPEKVGAGMSIHEDQNLPEMEGILKPTVEAMVLQALYLKIGEGLLKTKGAIAEVLMALVAWMTRFSSSIALGYLTYATLSSPLAHSVISQPSMKETKISFSRSLSILITHLSRANLQLATTLDFWQKQYDIREEAPGQTLDLLEAVDLSALSFQQSVLDTPSVNTRAGLFIFLNAMLYGRPLFDDIQVISYLNARYKDSIANLVTDMILASFDILANAMYRTESTTMLHSFLVNKLPVFLTNYEAMIFEPLSVGYCISQALARVDPAAFPSFSQMFDLLTQTAMLSEARQEFLFACALHQLIPEQSIEVLLGDVPMQSLPASGRYIKNELVAQCSSNPARIEEFIAELEKLEGNAGEIAAALLEIIHTLCTNNDTMTLKGVCGALCRKPQALDVLILFTDTVTLLHPLCHVLDNWQNHEDQGELQPVYAEFGSILLLIILAKHRFNLQPCDLGIDSSNSFVLKYLKSACVDRSPDDLTEDENRLLRGWIRGLFEAEGINDDLMSMCSPKEFHLLVATLFDQSLKACQAKVLAPETLRSGFEYLLEPFLLPSLAAGLVWFANHIWEINETSTDSDTAMAALHTLLKPQSLSNESSSIHELILEIAARPLEDSLSYAQRLHPLRTDINPLLDILKPLTQKQRQESAFLAEFEAWASAPGGGLAAALKHTIRSLVLWSSNTSYMPLPHYTHRQILETLRILGAKAVINTLIDEIMFQIGTENASNLEILLDIIVTMICAPQQRFPTPLSNHLGDHQAPIKRQLSLRDALAAELAQSFELSKTNLPRATMIVRVQRRVEALTGHAGNGMANEVGADETEALLHGNPDGGMSAVSIDDVLVEADNQIAAQAPFLGVG